jgi:hypothetical protein
MAKKKHLMDSEALNRIGQAMTKAYRGAEEKKDGDGGGPRSFSTIAQAGRDREAAGETAGGPTRTAAESAWDPNPFQGSVGTGRTRIYTSSPSVSEYRSTGYGEGVSDISTERKMGIIDKSRAGEDRETAAEYTRAEKLYDRLGTEIRAATDPIKRNQLILLRNEQLKIGQEKAQRLGREGLLPGKFPYTEPTSQTARAVGIASSGAKGKIGDVMTQQLGAGAGYERGQLFRGTSYASTGAINGVMRALAGIFILFVFIGVFYMVFGPIYDSLIFNFTNIVSADGDPTLGGKNIPAIFDNVAKVVLVWVPLLVFAGALYKLTALVFEREVGTRTTEETEWDSLLSGEDSMDLDMGSEPSTFEAYGGGW